MLWFWIRRGKPTNQFVQNLVNHTLSQINGAALTVTRNFQDGIFWKSIKKSHGTRKVWSVTDLQAAHIYMKGPSAVLSVQISAEKSGSLKAQEMIYTDCTKTMKLLSM